MGYLKIPEILKGLSMGVEVSVGRVVAGEVGVKATSFEIPLWPVPKLMVN